MIDEIGKDKDETLGNSACHRKVEIRRFRRHCAALGIRTRLVRPYPGEEVVHPDEILFDVRYVPKRQLRKPHRLFEDGI